MKVMHRLTRLDTTVAALIVIATLGLGWFVFTTTGQVRGALAGEVLEQQRDVSGLLREYAVLMGKLELAASSPGFDVPGLNDTLAAANSRLRTMRRTYTFSGLSGAAAAHALARPVVQDAEQWILYGLAGHSDVDSSVLRKQAHRRLSERFSQLQIIANRADQVARELVANEAENLRRFRNAMLTSLVVFSLMVLSIAWLMSRQRNTQAQLAEARKTHTQALKDSEARLKDFAESAADWFWESDAEGRLSYLSTNEPPRLGRSFEHSVEHVRNGLEREVDEGFDAWQAHLIAEMKTGREFLEKQFAWPQSDGRQVILSSSGKPVYDADGKYCGYRGVGRDLTARLDMEAELFERKQRGDVILASVADGVISTDSLGTVEYLNPAATTLTGWSLAHARGLPVDRVLRLCAETDDSTSYNPTLETLTQNREVELAGDTLLIARDSKKHHVRVRSAPIRGEDDEVLGAAVVLSDVSDARALERELRIQATFDKLTGLVNRGEFERRLGRAIESAKHDSLEHAVCYLDLDQFKIVNDTCGHAAGDELLRQVADVFTGVVRSRDTLGRLGGDEFAVLMEHCTTEQATRVASGLREALETFRFGWEAKTFTVGVSIGLVPVDAHTASVDAVLRAADAACYVAKDAGRNRVHLYREDDEQLAARQGEMMWVHQVANAVDDCRLHLVAQPIVALSAQQHVEPRYELLLRMLGENGQVICPGSFLPAVERYNMAPRLDRWVVESAFTDIAEHQVDGGAGLFAINLSGQSLSDETFLPFVLGQLDSSGADPQSICFEVTETAAVTDLRSATRFMSSLKSRGCDFALDDFGSGLSSFAYLKNLPVDFLKIDGAFVKKAAENPVDFEVVRAIHQIGKVMGKQTIAEFVEDDATLNVLDEIGVDFAQGFVLGRPDALPVVLAGAGKRSTSVQQTTL